MRIRNIMTSDPETLTPEKTLLDAAQLIEEKDIGGIPIVNEKNELIGLITKKHIINSYLKNIPTNISLKKIMTKDVTVINEEQELSKIWGKTFDRLPVITNKGKVVGILTGKDLIRFTLKILKDLSDVENLESLHQELESVKDLNRELDTIIEAVSDGLYITDGKGYTTRINSSYERISGIKAKEVIGKHMQELVDEGYYSESVTLHVLEEREPVTITHEIKTGKEVMVTGIPVFNEEGNIVRVVTTVRDMRALSKMKRELKETKKLSTRYYNELKQLRRQQLELDDVVVQSSKMKSIIDSAVRLGNFNSTVLITGESGVGKEIVASTIHKSSQTKEKQGSLIKVNCGAIPANLLESELFGYKKGAFTGANKDKPGFFELAENGTLFLDEIGEIPHNLQVKFLRALQERKIMRVGGTENIKINARIISATNQNLEKLVKEGKFRRDLYYRLNVVPIFVPPLRERKADIVPLTRFFLNKYNKEFKINKKLSLDLINFLEKYDWPGNVRELKNIIERLLVMVSDDIIKIEHLPSYFIDKVKQKNSGQFSVNSSNVPKLKDAVEKTEKDVLIMAMGKANTTREIANLIGVSQPTVVRKLQKYDLNI